MGKQAPSSLSTNKTDLKYPISHQISHIKAHILLNQSLKQRSHAWNRNPSQPMIGTANLECFS